jgi:hypothetical protein
MTAKKHGGGDARAGWYEAFLYFDVETETVCQKVAQCPNPYMNDLDIKATECRCGQIDDIILKLLEGKFREEAS